jgi:hydrogenase maturation protease
MLKIIAIGNRCMKDDGIAPLIAEHLLCSLSDSDFEIIITETDSMCGFYALNEDDFAVIIDAVHSGTSPGSVHTLDLGEALKKQGSCVSLHDLSIFDLLRIHQSKVMGLLIGIEVFEIGIGEGLSTALLEKLPQIHSEVECIIREYSLIKNQS